MLCQEPWCLTPDQFARLTDWQIEKLYAEPAADRARRMERERKGLPAEESADAPPAADVPKPGSRQHRAMWESGFVSMGMKPEAARAKYDAQLRRHNEKNKGA